MQDGKIKIFFPCLLQPSRDLGGAAIAVFTAKFHQPSTIPHEFTLKVLNLLSL